MSLELEINYLQLQVKPCPSRPCENIRKKFSPDKIDCRKGSEMMMNLN